MPWVGEGARNHENQPKRRGSLKCPFVVRKRPFRAVFGVGASEGTLGGHFECPGLKGQREEKYGV